MPAFIEHPLIYIGDYWLGILFYMLIFLLPIEILKLVDRKLNFIPSMFKTNTNYKMAGKISILVIIFLLMIYGTINARTIRVTNYNLTIHKNAGNLKSLRIALVSDIHIGSIIDKSRLEKLVAKVNSQKPDVILIAGDIVDDDINPLIKKGVYKVFSKLKSKYGTYGVLGNHDYYGGGPEKVVSYMKRANVDILRDSCTMIDNKFYVVGREDKTVERYKGKHRLTLQNLLKPLDKNKIIILLDHQPLEISKAANLGADIEFSGHTHGGQLFPDRFLSGRMYDNVYGEIENKNFYSIVTSGFGTWGPPVRIGSKSEVALINIKLLPK